MGPEPQACFDCSLPPGFAPDPAVWVTELTGIDARGEYQRRPLRIYRLTPPGPAEPTGMEVWGLEPGKVYEIKAPWRVRLHVTLWGGALLQLGPAEVQAALAAGKPPHGPDGLA